MCYKFIVIWMVSLGLFTLVHCKTDSNDVSALNVLYTSLGSPNKLSDWQSSGGDPCDDGWKGVTCSGSHVSEIKLSGFKLSGTLGYKLESLSSLTYLDLSNNKINGDIPYNIPKNLRYIDLSNNGFSGSFPYSISQMKNLEHLDLSNNQVNGNLNEVFNQLHKLDYLDLSHNQLNGNLPRGLGSLSSLSSLFLQNNQFNGQINVLSKLNLNDLNIANNQFSGWIPNELMKVKNLDIEGNQWSSGPAPPGMSSSDSVPSASKKGKLSGAIIAAIIIGILVLFIIVISIVSKKKRSSFSSTIIDEPQSARSRKSFASSFNVSREWGKGFSRELRKSFSRELGKSFSRELGKSKNLADRKSIDSTCSVDVKPMQSFDLVGQPLKNNSSNVKFQPRKALEVTSYTSSELLNATSNFASGRLLGEGSTGTVYKAKFSDGKVLAVKKFNSTFFQNGQPGNFLETVSSINKLYHPNIAELIGYCTEQGHYMLVYEYFRNGSLHEFLHLSSEFSRPLTWNTRVRIALGTAQAVGYLHETCFPPMVHRSIKSSNVLLDMELNPLLCDCGLANFYQDSQNVAAGYVAPEWTKGSEYTSKSDVYSFGVVMLELLTGRMPYDSSLPVADQYLVQWATPQLHDVAALDKMVDPALRGLYHPKSISRFADLISLCVKAEPVSRPKMSEVVQSLERVLEYS